MKEPASRATDERDEEIALLRAENLKMKNTLALVLEDEPLIAMDLEATLENAGFTVVTQMTCAEAQAWLAAHRPVVAVVDVQLRDGSSIDIAGKLDKIGVPFIVHSGEHPSQLEPPFDRGVWPS